MAIRIGMIGAGRLGRAHAEGLAAFPEVEIAGVCDSDRERAEALAQPYGATAHINFRTLLEAERLDAVVVCLPPFSRGEPEMRAVRKGIHLLVERPVALSVEKAREIQKEIAKAGVVSSVNYVWRYFSGTERALELLRDRQIALVRGWRFGRAPTSEWRRRRQASGGQFVHEATDLLDLARFVGGEMMSVCAMACEGLIAARHQDYDIEDATAAIVRFRGGAVGEIVCTNVAPREETALCIAADEMMLKITERCLEISEAGKVTSFEHTGSGLSACHEAFLEGVRTGKPGRIRCDYAEGVRTLEVSLAAAESARTGRVMGL